MTAATGDAKLLRLGLLNLLDGGGNTQVPGGGTGTSAQTLAPITASSAGGSGQGNSGEWLYAFISATGSGDTGEVGTGDPTDDFGNQLNRLPLWQADGAGGEPNRLPAIAASGAGVAGDVGTSDATLPDVTAAGVGSPGASGASAATLPSITGFGAGPDTSAQSLAAWTASGAGVVGHVGDSAVTLPVATAGGAGAVPVVGTSAQALPSVEGEGAGSTNELGTSAETLPSITAESSGGFASFQSIPAWMASGVGLTGQLGTSHQTLPSVTGDGSSLVVLVGASDQTLPIEIPASVGLAGVAGISNATLARIILAAEGLTGQVGTSSVDLPVVIADSAGHLQVVGTTSLTLPAIIAEATQPAASSGALAETLAMNTEKFGLTNYSVAFNSFAVFNGVTLAANAIGIFALTGDTDNGAIISARAKAGQTDFGDSRHKRVKTAYVGLRTRGEMVLRVTADEGDEYEYPVISTGSADLHTERVKLGRGLKGRYWQPEIANVNGADFDLDSIELVPELLSRRVG